MCVLGWYASGWGALDRVVFAGPPDVGRELSDHQREVVGPVGRLEVALFDFCPHLSVGHRFVVVHSSDLNPAN